MTILFSPTRRLRRLRTTTVLFSVSFLGIAQVAGAAGAPAPSGAAATPAKPKVVPGGRPAGVPAGKSPSAVPAPAPVKTAVPTKAPARKDASIAFFRDEVTPRLKIQIAEPELKQLRDQNREYVRCTVTEDDGRKYEHVGIHLKGSAGSFRGVDDRPALTLNFDKFNKDQNFHDLDKIHLNNSVQDPSYLNEQVCSEIFLDAGVPAARVTHARVWLNGRDLGMYVLMEGFNKSFLKRHSLDPAGNFYEAAASQEITGDLKLQSGSGPTDRSDVKSVIEACQEPDLTKRKQRMEQVVDIDGFLTFMALELMTCHWDGYCIGRNNYRFYFEPKSGKVHFFPHGMDQMFSDANFSVLNVPGSLVAGAVLSIPEWRGRYRDRLAELTKLFVPPDRLQARVEEHGRRLRPVLAEMGAGQASDFDRQVQEFKERLAARAKSLAEQTAVVERRPISLKPGGVAPLTRWEPRRETGNTRLETQEGGAGRMPGRMLTITVDPGGRSVASWRTKVLLPAGKYRFEARVRTQGVQAVSDTSGTGVGIRVSGSTRTQKLEGTSNWTALTHEFQIQEPMREVELVAELRATAGQAFFDVSSLRVVRTADR